MNEYITFEELIKNNNITTINNLLIEENINLYKLYQFVGIKDTNNGYINHIGNGNYRPKVLLNNFTFLKYNCKIINYLLNEKDLEYSIKNKIIKMVGLMIYNKDNKLMVIISYEFRYYNDYTITDFLNKKELNGEFIINLKRENKKDKIIHIFDNYSGNNNIVEKLVKFLTHDELISICNLYE